jgi:mannose-6-phosphate isomerase-like protein (cupin superfamily)
MATPNPKQIEKNWKSRGFSFGIFEDPPGRCWEDYSHGEDELFMVLEGEVELEMAGEVRMAGVGEELLIPAGTVHSVRNKGKKNSRWFYGYKLKV